MRCLYLLETKARLYAAQKECRSLRRRPIRHVYVVYTIYDVSALRSASTRCTVQSVDGYQVQTYSRRRRRLAVQPSLCLSSRQSTDSTPRAAHISDSAHNSWIMSTLIGDRMSGIVLWRSDNEIPSDRDCGTRVSCVTYGGLTVRLRMDARTN